MSGKLIPYRAYLLILVFTLIYLLLPTENSGSDAYAYASSVRWNRQLTWPHHLLYCYLGRFFFILLHAIGIKVSALGLMKCLNALAAGVILWICYQLLRKINIYRPTVFVMFIGSCFGFMRFATENETYIFPILFSMLGTWLFLYRGKPAILFISALCFATAALFHQIHILWFLGFMTALFFSKEISEKRSFMLFTLGGLLPVVAIYIIIYHYFPGGDDTLTRFVLRDVYSGQVNTGISYKNFLLTPVSLIRSFVQVHGYMAALLKSYPALFVLPLALIILLISMIRDIYRFAKRLDSGDPTFSNAVIFALTLHVLFAFYSVGNAEFTVMLPILFTIVMLTRFAVPLRAVKQFSLAMLAWNMAFGLAPLHFLDLNGNQALLNKMEHYRGSSWIMYHPQQMENMYDYSHGYGSADKRIVRVETLETEKFPFRDSLPEGGLFTDCIRRNSHFNRGNWLNGEQEGKRILEFFRSVPADSVLFFGGMSRIDRLTVKGN